MKIKRFLAKSMREAIRLVREEQGPDAVILSNRRVGAEIEVVAAVDYDVSLIQQVQRQVRQEISEASDEAAAHKIEIEKPVAAPSPSPAPAITPESIKADNIEMTQVREELSDIRRLMERQLAGLIWKDLKQSQPERVAVLSALTDIGLDSELAQQIAGEVPEQVDSDRARFLPLGLLSRKIPIAKNDPVLEGGVIALIGPTGVGKTTTLAKLAARYAENFGTRDLALVTTDHYRIGAQEQLFTYGRLLGIPVYTASNGAELSDLMKRLSDRKMVLIDTAGMAPRDCNLAAQFSELQGISRPIKTFLVMSANSQAGSLNEIVNRFGTTPLAGCILTKLDESTRIGGALSVAIRHELPIAFTTDGQKVPEDLQLARADRLVIRAMQLVRQCPSETEDTTLAVKFSGANYANA